jgi:hypothetical protein
MNQNILMGITILIFIICFPTAIALKGKIGDKDKCADIIITGGIGSILAGTLFGIVKPVILQQSIDGAFIYLIIILFFVWYLLVKMFSLLLHRINTNSNIVAPNPFRSQISTFTTSIALTNDNIDSDNGDSSSQYTILSYVFISMIGILIIAILGVSLYQQSKTGSNSPLMSYVIIMSVMIVLSQLFSFFSGVRINVDKKVQIMSYTLSYAVVFGILATIFIFNNFKLSTTFTTALIFFVWMTLTASISNFLTYNPPIIKRY